MRTSRLPVFRNCPLTLWSHWSYVRSTDFRCISTAHSRKPCGMARKTQLPVASVFYQQKRSSPELPKQNLQASEFVPCFSARRYTITQSTSLNKIFCSLKAHAPIPPHD